MNGKFEGVIILLGIVVFSLFVAAMAGAFKKEKSQGEVPTALPGFTMKPQVTPTPTPMPYIRPGTNPIYFNGKGAISPDLTCWSAEDTGRMRPECRILPPPKMTWEQQRARPSCTESTEVSTRVGTCSFQLCPIYTGGAMNDEYGNDINSNGAPQRVFCDVEGINQCFCRNDTCKSIWGGNLCLHKSRSVRYGVARDVPEWQCPFYYCQVWDHDKAEWRFTLDDEKCSKICIPELYEGHMTLPPDVSTDEQLKLLKSYIQSVPMV